MSVEFLNNHLHWPKPDEIYSPSGAGPRVLVELARNKIERELGRKVEANTNVKVGLLTKTPAAAMTAAPIAVICEFSRPVSNQVLAEAHRLAWNFSRSPLLITIEPQLIRTCTCCEVPATTNQEIENLGFQIQEAKLEFSEDESPSSHAAHALNWVRLASGDFYREFPERFKRDGRADAALLAELKSVRAELANQDLPDDIIHDLIARVIFIQFLFDRKDSEGRAALNPALLKRLHHEGTLKKLHDDLQTILTDFKEAYRFFAWLNTKFNGDLFPGKGQSKTAQEKEWRAEKAIVEERHLKTLSDFVNGTLRLGDRQRLLWSQYSFDVIPLEFISSVYEEFVTSSSAHYTPGFLVDFMLDGVLPWDSDEWDLKILDPACGSGIFLVKAYQRLIQRWKNANPQQQPSAAVLRGILENNLFGVDIDPHAVRVASFSLYLTMCDEIDPKNYLRSTKFPTMRGERLIHSDFFAEGVSGFDTVEDSELYDLIVGNAPWGKDSATNDAKNWAKHKDHRWEIANKAIGTLFLAKSAEITNSNGMVSLIQPASSLLFNRSGPPTRFREKFFSTYKVLEVVNLSTLRFELFENAISPPCIVTFSPKPPNDEPIIYISPKQMIANGAEIGENSFSIVVDPYDVSSVFLDEAVSENLAWVTLAWGGRRDFALIRRLQKLPNIKSYLVEEKVLCRNGLERGSREIEYAEIVDLPMLESTDFPPETFLQLDSAILPINQDPQTHRRTSLDAFKSPQLFVKRSWTRSVSRFRSVYAKSEAHSHALCSQNYVSIHFPPELEESAKKANVLLNSRLAVYFFFLTSGRMSAYRPNITVDEVLSIPVPDKGLDKSQFVDFENVDREAIRLCELKDGEQAIVEDALNISLLSLHGANHEAVGSNWCAQAELKNYCEFFLRVLNSTFAEPARVTASIFEKSTQNRLPVRLVAFYLDSERDEKISIEKIESEELCYLLNQLNEKYLEINGHERGGIFFQRVARIYSEQTIDGKPTPVVYIVKPDRVRYWTRSAGLRDADEVAADAQFSQIGLPLPYEQAEG